MYEFDHRTQPVEKNRNRVVDIHGGPVMHLTLDVLTHVTRRQTDQRNRIVSKQNPTHGVSWLPMREQRQFHGRCIVFSCWNDWTPSCKTNSKSWIQTFTKVTLFKPVSKWRMDLHARHKTMKLLQSNLGERCRWPRVWQDMFRCNTKGLVSGRDRLISWTSWKLGTALWKILLKEWNSKTQTGGKYLQTHTW